jgi:hypothetical protein
MRVVGYSNPLRDAMEGELSTQTLYHPKVSASRVFLPSANHARGER